MTQLWQKSAGELAHLIREGEVSSLEVVDAHLERIDEVNERVNAIVEVRPEQVRDDARRADEARGEGRALGLLHGVPFTVKTNLDVAGYATSEGCASLKDFMADSDAPTVERMRGAGGIVLARTNMPDLGLRVNTESSLYGATHNPWRHGVTAGGSSGGEATSLATGMSPIGLGNDLGGSLRNPAFACGVTSIKPSRGRVPAGNPSAQIESGLHDQLMLVEGVLARHVSDLRLGLSCVMGAHHRDPQAVDAPLQGPPLPRRVALVPAPGGGETHSDIQDGVRAAGRALESAGYEVEEIEPPKLIEAYFAWVELVWTSLRSLRPLLDAFMGEDGRRYLDLSDVGLGEPSEASLFQMHLSRYSVARAWREFMEDYPLIVGPTWAQPPFPHGFDIQDAESALKVAEIYRFVLPANVFGLPAVAVPTGVANGLPTGAQVIGRPFREDLCLRAGEAIENSLGTITPIDPRD